MADVDMVLGYVPKPDADRDRLLGQMLGLLKSIVDALPVNDDIVAEYETKWRQQALAAIEDQFDYIILQDNRPTEEQQS